MREKALGKVDYNYKEFAICLINFLERLLFLLEKDGILFNTTIAVVIYFVTETNVEASDSIENREYWYLF